MEEEDVTEEEEEDWRMILKMFKEWEEDKDEMKESCRKEPK